MNIHPLEPAQELDDASGWLVLSPITHQDVYVSSASAVHTLQTSQSSETLESTRPMHQSFKRP